MGLDEDASQEKIEAAYSRLRNRLNLEQYETGSLGRVQAEQCLLSIENAYRTLANSTARAKYVEEWKRSFKEPAGGVVQPKLGQLCVAAGIITLDELEKA